METNTHKTGLESKTWGATFDLDLVSAAHTVVDLWTQQIAT